MPKDLAKRAERLRLQDCQGMVRVGDVYDEATVERALPACRFVDKQYEALMSSPGPRPAETRVSDDIPLCMWPTGGRPASFLRRGWEIALDVTRQPRLCFRGQGNLVCCTVQNALRRHALASVLINNLDLRHPTLLYALVTTRDDSTIEFNVSTHKIPTGISGASSEEQYDPLPAFIKASRAYQNSCTLSRPRLAENAAVG